MSRQSDRIQSIFLHEFAFICSEEGRIKEILTR